MGEPSENSGKPKVFRISEIPSSWTSEKLKAVLEENGIKTLSDIRLIPSVLTPITCTATITLDTTSPFLQKLNQDPMADCLLYFEGNYLVIDQHFYGLTAISSPVDIKADIIAVHGLSGHAFGSWAYFDGPTKKYIMWLRDFLSEDVPGIRILTYGYEAKLDKTTTMSRLLDYRRSFVGDLITSRKGIEERPLILFGHSFGGTLIAQALETAKFEQEKPDMLKLLRSVSGIFFFATPHRGLRTTEISQMTKERTEESKTKLLADIEKDSETLRRSLETLATLCIDIQIVSVYEELQTPSVIKVWTYQTVLK